MIRYARKEKKTSEVFHLISSLNKLKKGSSRKMTLKFLSRK